VILKSGIKTNAKLAYLSRELRQTFIERRNHLFPMANSMTNKVAKEKKGTIVAMIAGTKSGCHSYYQTTT
jgi:hypothetical protein